MLRPGPASNRRIVLASRPIGLPTAANFRIEVAAVPEPGPGQVLLRHTHLGLAPAARLRMGESASYAKPMDLGEVVYGQAAGLVTVSRDPRFVSGAPAVSIHNGWQEWSVVDADKLIAVDTALAPVTVWLGALGTSGMTAYVGLLDIGTPKAGECVVVSAASGGVGSVVGQIAKALGCQVVGIAGGASKCAHVVDQLGFDACVDHRAPDLPQRLAQACPNGIDVYFENVGGASRDAAWPLLNLRARVIVCGLISEYNDARAPGPGWFQVLSRRLRVEGFILSDRLERRADFERDMRAWFAAGRIRVHEDVSHGLEQAVPAFIGMLQGRNLGKTLVAL